MAYLLCYNKYFRLVTFRQFLEVQIIEITRVKIRFKFFLDVKVTMLYLNLIFTPVISKHTHIVRIQFQTEFQNEVISLI